MTQNTIVSLTGGDITETTPFVLITVPSFSMYKKYESDTMIIYGFDKSKLNSQLSSNKINGSFVPVSDVLIIKNSEQNPTQTLLVNKTLSISVQPMKYEKVIKMNNGYIWKPSDSTFPTIYKSIGLVYSNKNPSKSTFGARLIDANYLTSSEEIINNMSTDNFVYGNNYGSFVLDYDEKYTINTQKIIHTMLQSTTKNSSLIENMTNMSNDSSDKNYHVLPEGRLEYDSKCVVPNLNDETTTNIDCTYAPLQQWKMTNGNIFVSDTNKCLGENNSLYECDITKKGKHSDPNEPDVRYPSWQKKFGKNVVLVSSDNPWYLNKDITQPMAVEEDPNDCYSGYYKTFGTFNDRQIGKVIRTQPNNGIEYFGDQPFEHNGMSFDIFHIISCIVVLIIIIKLFMLVFRH